MKLYKTFSLKFITNNDKCDNKIEISNIDEFKNQNPRCQNCFLNKGCYCQLYNMISSNITSQHVIDIIKYLQNLYIFNELNIEIYKNGVVNIDIYELKFSKLRNISNLNIFLNKTSSCKHLKYIGTNNKKSNFNIYFG